MSPSQGTFVTVSFGVSREQAADHDRLAVAHHDGVLDAAVGERDADVLGVSDACLERAR